MSSGSALKKGIGCGLFAAFAPLLGCGGLAVLMMAVLFGGAGGILGWLFGGGAPSGTPGASPPSGPPVQATPTPVPVSCYITTTPVIITLPPDTPQPTTTFGVLTPSPTAVNTPTPAYTSLSTPTPCPTSNLQWSPTPPAQAGSNLAEFALGGVSYGYNPLGPATIGLNIFTSFLAEMGSPASSEAQQLYQTLIQQGADPAVALAFFEHESSGGRYGVAALTHSWGNLRCTPPYQCYQTEGNGAFRSYPDWVAGASDWVSLMHYYRDNLGRQTLDQIVPLYAPTSDGNAPASYIQTVKARVNDLRQREWADGPHGSPYHAPYVVTQGYGCTETREFYDTSCASASGGAKPYFHRGVDLVSLGDKTIYATVAGTVDYAGSGEDGFGIRVYLRKGAYLVIYAHLSRLLVTTGQHVELGQALGLEGNTGYSTGSHLHYQIQLNGQWVDSSPYLLPR